LLLGLGGESAAAAAALVLVAHALYKGALFLTAGALDHGAGARDLRRLGGLARTMPLTAAAALVATLSMVGLPPTLGYVGEEELLRATWEHGWPTWARTALTAVVTAALALYAAAALLVGLGPF